jgi:hypothetical protein
MNVPFKKNFNLRDLYIFKLLTIKIIILKFILSRRVNLTNKDLNWFRFYSKLSM